MNVLTVKSISDDYDQVLLINKKKKRKKEVEILQKCVLRDLDFGIHLTFYILSAYIYILPL